MDQKINNKFQALKPSPLKNGVGLGYKSINSSWGLAALFKDYQLVFSDGHNNPSISEGAWKKIFPFFKTTKKQTIANADEINVYNVFSLETKEVWQRSYLLAKKHRKLALSSEDIFLSLIKTKSIEQIFARLGVSVDTAETFLNNYLKLSPGLDSPVEIKKIPFATYAEASKLHAPNISPSLLLFGLLSNLPKQHILQAIFANIGLSLEKLEILTIWEMRLEYEFAPGSRDEALLNCCQQAALLEELFKYYFEYAAIEAALMLDPKNPMSLLVKAGLGAKKKGSKVVTEDQVKNLV
jgi:hypothetical protein